ncbi:MAG: hypothetical protein U5K30_11515 [Acidimicrobiales bacterium]|nr:hypothetical protein [Acidimicrobiales bacterium]
MSRRSVESPSGMAAIASAWRRARTLRGGVVAVAVEEAVDDQVLVPHADVGELGPGPLGLFEGRGFGSGDQHQRGRGRVGQGGQGDPVAVVGLG